MKSCKSCRSCQRSSFKKLNCYKIIDSEYYTFNIGNIGARNRPDLFLSDLMTLSERDLSPGDHIFVKRKTALYSHHGIYAGDGKVFHYTGAEKEKKDPLVRKTTIGDFLKGGKLRRRDYKKRLSCSETLKIAKDHLASNGYSLAFNNCEHFASYCATGNKKSRQVHNLIGAFVGITLAVTGAIIKKSRKKSGDAL